MLLLLLLLQKKKKKKKKKKNEKKMKEERGCTSGLKIPNSACHFSESSDICIQQLLSLFLIVLLSISP